MAVHQQRFWKTNPFTDERFIIFNWSFTTYHPLCHLIHSKASNVWGFPVKGNVYILLWAVKKLSREIKKYHLWWRCLNINAVKSYNSSVPSRHMERLSSSVIFDSTSSRKAHTHTSVLYYIVLYYNVFLDAWYILITLPGAQKQDTK